MKSIKIFIASTIFFSIGMMHGQISNEKTFIDWNNVEMPVSPNAASLGKYGETPVNTATGIPNISIPLYTLQVDGVSVPISLSYHASGIQVDELATAVGLKWTLNAGGGIFRSVSGKPDEEGWLNPSSNLGPIPDSFYDDYNNIEEEAYQIYMLGGGPNYRGYAALRDHNPDNYSYSFLGYSGKYITDFYGEVIKNQADNLTISGNTILDQTGNTYNFGQSSLTETSNRSFTNTSTKTGGSQNDLDSYSFDANIITGWMLTSIVTKNGKTISFDYDPYTIEEHTPHNTANTIAFGSVCGLANSDYAEKTATSVWNDYTVRLIKKISSENVDILFDYAPEDQNLSTWKKKLNKITINDKLTGAFKEFHFEYDKYGGDPRLRLKRVYEKKGTQELPGYSFSYVEGNLPNKYSFSQDFFGYYNGKTNHSLAPWDQTIKDTYFSQFQTFYDANTGDRTPDLNYLKIGVLDSLKYPTGGSTKFFYETNAEYDTIFNKVKYCGGLRVGKIEDIDNNNQVLKTTTYSYEGLEGQSFETNLEFLMRIDKSNVTGPNNVKYTFHSSFIEREALNLSGYFYKKVTERVTDGGEQQKKESNFIEHLSYGTRGNLMSSEKIFRGSSIAKLVEYEYGGFGNSQTVHWNILGVMYCLPKVVLPPTAPQGYMGYDFGYHTQYTGNWTMLPTLIATTDYLKQGSGNEAVTTVQTFDYDDATLLKLSETTDMKRTREVVNNVVQYNITDPNGELTTTTYKYPRVPIDENLPGSIPDGLFIRKQISSARHGGTILGQALEYDGAGNVIKTYGYNKGEIGNNSPLGYMDDYEYMSSIDYENGKPVQVLPKNGVAISYIWGYGGQYPVAKIEGKALAGLNSTLVSQIKAENSESALRSLLDQLRNDPSTAGAMVTTYTYEPLNGVKTITDPKGDKSTFFYDSFGRLVKVTDKDNKILTENVYNYAH